MKKPYKLLIGFLGLSGIITFIAFHFIAPYAVVSMHRMKCEMKDTKLNYQLLKLKTFDDQQLYGCLLYTSPSPRDLSTSRMPSSA